MANEKWKEMLVNDIWHQWESAQYLSANFLNATVAKISVSTRTMAGIVKQASYSVKDALVKKEAFSKSDLLEHIDLISAKIPYKKGELVKCTITQLPDSDLGAFVKTDEGYSGLIHKSKIVGGGVSVVPTQYFTIGQRIEAFYYDHDSDGKIALETVGLINEKGLVNTPTATSWKPPTSAPVQQVVIPPTQPVQPPVAPPQDTTIEGKGLATITYSNEFMSEVVYEINRTLGVEISPKAKELLTAVVGNTSQFRLGRALERVLSQFDGDIGVVIANALLKELAS